MLLYCHSTQYYTLYYDNNNNNNNNAHTRETQEDNKTQRTTFTVTAWVSSDGRFTHCFFAVCLWLCFASHRIVPRRFVCLVIVFVTTVNQSLSLSHLCSLVPAMLSLWLFDRFFVQYLPLSLSLFVRSLIVAYHLWCVLAVGGSMEVGGKERRIDRERASALLVQLRFISLTPNKRCSTPTLLLCLLFWLALFMLIKLTFAKLSCYEQSAELWPTFVWCYCCCAIIFKTRISIVAFHMLKALQNGISWDLYLDWEYETSLENELDTTLSNKRLNTADGI